MGFSAYQRAKSEERTLKMKSAKKYIGGVDWSETF